jgi:hypothetical protein
MEIMNMDNASMKLDEKPVKQQYVTYEEFLILVDQLNIAFRGRNSLNNKDEINFYWNCLNSFTAEALNKAILTCISKEKWYPTISDIISHLNNCECECDWVIVWQSFITRSCPLHEINKPGQFAISVVGKYCLENLIENGKQNIAAREFKENYERFYTQNIEEQIKKCNMQNLFFFEDPEVKRRLEIEQIEKEKQEVINRFLELDEKVRERLLHRKVFNLETGRVDYYMANEEDAIALKSVGIDLY